MNLVDILQMSKEEARAYLEKLRWPNGPICPRGARREESHDVYKLEGKSARPGVYNCRTCRKLYFSSQFTVTVGTIFEDSHIPLNKWLGAFYLMCASKKGVSSNQLHRTLGVTYKTAWFMTHRIRYAMKTKYNAKDKLFGIVEADETFVGGKTSIARKNKNKFPVLALVQRGGNVRTKSIRRVTTHNLRENLQRHIDPSAVIVTDQWPAYRRATRGFKKHLAVNHSKGEYVRGIAYTNTVESFFALLKRGVYGTFHHVSGKHLPRYCSEFEFRYNHRKLEDDGILVAALKGAEDKRMTYNPGLKMADD